MRLEDGKTPMSKAVSIRISQGHSRATPGQRFHQMQALFVRSQAGFQQSSGVLNTSRDRIGRSKHVIEQSERLWVELGLRDFGDGRELGAHVDRQRVEDLLGILAVHENVKHPSAGAPEDVRERDA